MRYLLPIAIDMALMVAGVQVLEVKPDAVIVVDGKIVADVKDIPEGSTAQMRVNPKTGKVSHIIAVSPKEQTNGQDP